MIRMCECRPLREGEKECERLAKNELPRAITMMDDGGMLRSSHRQRSMQLAWWLIKNTARIDASQRLSLPSACRSSCGRRYGKFTNSDAEITHCAQTRQERREAMKSSCIVVLMDCERCEWHSSPPKKPPAGPPAS